MCNECPAGSYTPIDGYDECLLCPIGTYNPSKGGNSLRQCYPCSENFFSDVEGSSFCKTCPSDMQCPVGSSKPLKGNLILDSVWTQPKMYENDLSVMYRSLNDMYIYVFIVLGTMLMLSIFSKSVKERIEVIDLFKQNHNYSQQVPMQLKITQIGGYFTLFFIVAAIILISISAINYHMNNIDEIKSLVPLVALQNSASMFYATIQINSILYRYGGTCLDPSTKKCSQFISFSINSIAYEKT